MGENIQIIAPTAIALLVGLVVLFFVLRRKREEETIVIDQNIINELKDLESKENEKKLDQPSPNVDDVNAELDRLLRRKDERRKMDSDR